MPSIRSAVLLAVVLAIAGIEPVGAASLTVHVVDRSGAAVDDAVVYALPSGPVSSARTPAAAAIAQVQKAFTPLVTVVQTGGSVSFPNRDTVRHHVYSFSPAKVFELKLYAGLPSAPVVFDKAGLVVLGCNIHDAMVAYVMVVDTSYFAKTPATGLAKVDGLPAGDYKVVVWHPRMTAPSAPRTTAINGDTSVDVVVELKPGA